MGLSRVVSEIFNVEICRDLEIPVKSQSRSLNVVPFDRLGTVFLLVFYSNFVPKTHHFWDIRLVNYTWKPGLGVTQVIRADTDRSATYDFLLTFHSNHGPISYRFRDKRRFQSKFAKFSQPRVYCAHRWRDAPWNWIPTLGVKKLEVMGLPGWERNLTISSAVWIQCTNVTDGRTDTGRQQRPRLRIASRGKIQH